MSGIGQQETLAQGKAICLVVNNLGYEYLGNWYELNSTNIIESLL